MVDVVGRRLLSLLCSLLRYASEVKHLQRKRYLAAFTPIVEVAFSRTSPGSSCKAIPNPRQISRSHKVLEDYRDELSSGTLPTELYAFETLVHFKVRVRVSLKHGQFNTSKALSTNRRTALETRGRKRWEKFDNS